MRSRPPTRRVASFLISLKCVDPVDPGRAIGGRLWPLWCGARAAQRAYARPRFVTMPPEELVDAANRRQGAEYHRDENGVRRAGAGLRARHRQSPQRDARAVVAAREA